MKQDILVYPRITAYSEIDRHPSAEIDGRSMIDLTACLDYGMPAIDICITEVVNKLKSLMVLNNTIILTDYAQCFIVASVHCRLMAFDNHSR